MTYCVGILVREGLVMMADTRTNAGVDNVSRYRKLRVFGLGTDRLIMVASAGSLSTTQGAMHRMAEGVHNPETDNIDKWETVPSIYQAVLAVGRALRAARDGMESLEQGDINFDASLLVGGAVGGEPHRLFSSIPLETLSNAARTRRSCKSARRSMASRSSTERCASTRRSTRRSRLA